MWTGQGREEGECWCDGDPKHYMPVNDGWVVAVKEVHAFCCTQRLHGQCAVLLARAPCIATAHKSLAAPWTVGAAR